MHTIEAILKAELAAKGVISFAHFMELALYCPNFGYYERLNVSPGRKGDFYTSVSVGELFGQLLARQAAEWLADLGEQRCQILEAGAHDGQLAVDILKELKTGSPKIFERVKYWILEPSARRKKEQQARLMEFADKVEWFASWEELPPEGVRGLIISNELLDAMPVHRLRWDAAQKKWFEWGVAVENDKFVWKKLPDDERFTAKDFCLDLGENSSEATPQLFNILPDGFTTELCPLASQWWTQAARHLKAGKLAAFDYGLTGDQFFTPERHAGTLRAYRNHRQSNDLLNFPGEQDITAQVNFSSLIRAGESEGLPTEYFNTQARFLTNLAQNISRRDPQFGEWITARSRAFQTLTHPEHLGRSFRVLVQSR